MPIFVPTGRNVLVTDAELTYMTTSLSTCKTSGRLMVNLCAVPVDAALESTIILKGNAVSILFSRAYYAAARSSWSRSVEYALAT